MNAPLNVVALSGSLRRGSFNQAALRAAQELAPADMTVAIADIAPLPVYNGDVEAEGLPSSVVSLAQQVGAADALIIATPEYNYSIPGVLKNTIDWLSRVDGKTFGRLTGGHSPLNAKPLAILGCSMGQFGTARAQLHLRQICIYTNMLPLNRPEVLIGHAQDKFSADGRLHDEQTRAFVGQLLAELAAWCRTLAHPAAPLFATEAS